MLQNIRDNIQGTIAKVIVAIIIVPFAIFGIDTLINSGGPAPVAEVNGKGLSADDLSQEVMLQKRQLMAMMGDKIQPEMLDDTRLREPALDRLITRELLQQAADALKLRVSTQMVDNTIRSVPQFQEDGKFSPERYQQLLREQGFSPAYYKQLLQRELVVDQLQTGLSESEFATGKEVDVVTGLLQQQRSFSYVVLPVASFAGNVEVAAAEIDSYYKAHLDQYQRDERVKLDYVELRSGDFANKVDEAAIRAEYERFVAAFKPSTERHAAHILVEINDKRGDADALARANEISAKLAAGAAFEKLVDEYSDDLNSKGNAGDLGVSRGDLFPPAIETALVTLKAGEVSAPVKSDAGYHVIKLLAQTTEAVPSFEASKAEIAQRLTMDGVQPKLVSAVEKLRDLVFNADGLEAPAKEMQLAVRESEWMDRNSADPLFGDAKLRAAVFSKEVLEERNNSDVIELTPEHYVVVRVKSHEPATPKPLEEVRAQVLAAVKSERAMAAAQQLAGQMRSEVEGGGDLLKLAEKGGFKAQAETNAERTGGQNAEVTRAAFAMPRPSAGKSSVMVKTLANGDAAVIHLQTVAVGASDSLSAPQKASLVSQLEQSVGTATFAATLENLRKTADIERR